MKRSARIIGLGILSALCILNTAQASFDYDETGSVFLAGEALVRFKPGTTLADAQAIVSACGGHAASVRFLNFRPNPKDTPQAIQLLALMSRTASVKFDETTDVADFCAKIAAYTDIAEANHVFGLHAVPNDLYYPLQWGLRGPNYSAASPFGAVRSVNNGFVDAWTTAKGDGVNVAVIDSGADLQHPDLAGVLQNLGDTTYVVGTNSLAQPGGGAGAYPTNPATPGMFDQAFPWDDVGHGTHVCGIIAAKSGNKIGISGAAPNVKIAPIKLFNCINADPSLLPAVTEVDVTASLYCATKLTPVPRVINMSFGGGGGALTSAAIAYVQTQIVGSQKGIVCVASMGNDPAMGGAVAISYPACLPGVVAVAAHLRDGSLAPYSIQGPWCTVAAPGGNNMVVADGVLSTYPGYPVMLGAPVVPNTKGAGAYTFMAGTSMAAPHVTAAAALLLQKRPALSQAQVWANFALFSDHTVTNAIGSTVSTRFAGSRVLATTNTFTIPDSAHDIMFGYGILNPRRLLDANLAPALKSKSILSGIPHVFAYWPRNQIDGPTTMGTAPTVNALDTVDQVSRGLNTLRVLVVNDKGDLIPKATVKAHFSVDWYNRYQPTMQIPDLTLYDDASHTDVIGGDGIYTAQFTIPTADFEHYLGSVLKIQYIVTAPGMSPNTNTCVRVKIH